MSEDRLSCSFCGVSKIQTKILVAGEDAHICDQCIEQAYSILSLQNQPEEANKLDNFSHLNPKSIKQFLDDYVVGQEYSKKVISVDVNEFIKTAGNDYRNIQAWNCPTQEAIKRIEEESLYFDLAIVDADHSRDAAGGKLCLFH